MGYFNLLIGIFATVILFLHALQGFSREVQEVGGERLKSWLQNLTSNRLAGFTLGAGFTALVQSSSAVTALAVALVDAGAISFTNSLAILVGANVGTTSTALLVSYKLTGVGAVFIVVGGIMAVLPKPMNYFGKPVFYFGFIFFALDLIGASLDPIKEDPYIVEILSKASTPLIGALAGAVLTALLQSSSVVTGLSILLAQQGIIDIQAAVAIIIGANAGTTVTGLIAAIPMQAQAKRTALANLLINMGGVIIFLPFTAQLANFVTGINSEPGLAVAAAHIVFNVGVAIIALPLVGIIARWLAPPLPD